MEDFFIELARGNVTEVNVVLASVIAALAVLQLVLIATAYGNCGRPSSVARRRDSRTGPWAA